jgi:hypothetical protein
MRNVGIDRIGAVASAICAVHCLLTGVALGLLSYAGLGFMGSVTTDAIFLAIAVTIAIVAIVHGIRKHHSYKPALVFVFGLFCVVMGHFVLHHEHATNETEMHMADILSTVFSVSGGIAFVLFHVVNLRLQKQCGCQHCSTGE